MMSKKIQQRLQHQQSKTTTTIKLIDFCLNQWLWKHFKMNVNHTRPPPPYRTWYVTFQRMALTTDIFLICHKDARFGHRTWLSLRLILRNLFGKNMEQRSKRGREKILCRLIWSTEWWKFEQKMNWKITDARLKMLFKLIDTAI